MNGRINQLPALLVCVLLCWSAGAWAQQAVLTDESVVADADTPKAASEAAAEDTGSTRQPSANAPSQVRSSAANDTLVLDATSVTGTRELPKVLYIVPWKKAELGALPAQPSNSLLDETLMPLDRDVFRREVTYYDGAPADRARQR